MQTSATKIKQAPISTSALKAVPRKSSRVGSVGRTSLNTHPNVAVSSSTGDMGGEEHARKGSIILALGNNESVLSQKMFEPIHEIVEIHNKPIFKLLKSFKLQQYAIRLTELGYGEDIYKLAMLSHRQREDIVEKLFALPGHKSKLFELFKVID